MIKSISVVYPVFNEEKRLKKTFEDINKFEKKNKNLKKEYIFVNDGSTDRSIKIIKTNFKNKKNVKIISYKKNLGKGYALKKGVKNAKNKWIITIDSDCSVSLFQLIEWIKKKYFDDYTFIYFASRNHQLSKVKKKKIRKFIGLLFKFLIFIFFKIKISDTQCGFKVYKSNIAKKIFKKIRIYDYVHDIEICLLAKELSMKIKILPVKWTHIEGSKISFVNDTFKVLKSLIKLSKRKYKTFSNK